MDKNFISRFGILLALLFLTIISFANGNPRSPLRLSVGGNECEGVNDCPQNTVCIPEPKQCFTTPCPQHRCDPVGDNAPSPRSESPMSPTRTGCETIRCRAGYICVPNQIQCIRAPCPKISGTGHCVPAPQVDLPGPNPEAGSGSCPSNEGMFSTCDWTDCTQSGCQDGQICCPKACGGTSCVAPVYT